MNFALGQPNLSLEYISITDVSLTPNPWNIEGLFSNVLLLNSFELFKRYLMKRKAEQAAICTRNTWKEQSDSPMPHRGLPYHKHFLQQPCWLKYPPFPQIPLISNPYIPPENSSELKIIGACRDGDGMGVGWGWDGDGMGTGASALMAPLGWRCFFPSWTGTRASMVGVRTEGNQSSHWSLPTG